MQLYKHIVVALELMPESDKAVIAKAKELVKQFNATMTLIHVIEHMVNFGAAYTMPAGVEIEHELTEAAKRSMQAVGETLNVPLSQQKVITGTAKHVIVDEAKKLHADLIIVGSHGRHGVRLLLGSTANAILHAAHCDVLAVRIQTP